MKGESKFDARGIMRLRKINPKWPNIQECLRCINTLRGYYPFSNKTYQIRDIENVYLILTEKTTCGYVECRYESLDIELPKQITLWINDIHIAPDAQRRGIAERVFDHLLGKNCLLKMCVVKENEKMNDFLNKYKYKRQDSSENVDIIVVSQKKTMRY